MYYFISVFITVVMLSFCTANDELATRMGIDPSDTNYCVIKKFADHVQGDTNATGDLIRHYAELAERVATSNPNDPKLDLSKFKPSELQTSDEFEFSVMFGQDQLRDSAVWESNLSYAWGYIELCFSYLSSLSKKEGISFHYHQYRILRINLHSPYIDQTSRQFLPLAIPSSNGLISEELILYALLNNIWLVGYSLTNHNCSFDGLTGMSSASAFNHDLGHLCVYQAHLAYTGFSQRMREHILSSEYVLSADDIRDLFSYAHEFDLTRSQTYLTYPVIKNIFRYPEEYKRSFVHPQAFAFLDDGKLRETPKTWYVALSFYLSVNQKLRTIGADYLKTIKGHFRVILPLCANNDRQLKPPRYYLFMSAFVGALKEIMNLSDEDLATFPLNIISYVKFDDMMIYSSTYGVADNKPVFNAHIKEKAKELKTKVFDAVPGWKSNSAIKYMGGYNSSILDKLLSNVDVISWFVRNFGQFDDGHLSDLMKITPSDKWGELVSYHKYWVLVVFDVLKYYDASSWKDVFESILKTMEQKKKNNTSFLQSDTKTSKTVLHDVCGP